MQGRGSWTGPRWGAALGPFPGTGAAAHSYSSYRVQSSGCFPAGDFFAEDVWLCVGSRREPL